MKFVIPLILLAITVALIVVGPLFPGRFSGTVGIAAGEAIPGLGASANTPQQAVTNFLADVQKRNWGALPHWLTTSSNGTTTEDLLTKEFGGTDGSLRSFSSLSSWELQPLHESGQDAQIRATLHWSTPVGPIDELRDLKVVHEGDGWRIAWSAPNFPDVPAQVIPVNYLRWDLVSSSASDEWGQRSVDAPKVRIVSMNPVEYEGGAVVMGELVNEDTIPAFVNVNATLVDGDGKTLDEESSFDKISHVLLPKQVTPYRIDFPGINLQSVKNVHMDVKATLVPASADPVIGIMNQSFAKDSQGRTALRGELMNESGKVVNIPHVIATFYDNSGRVIWVSDGYVDRALLPQTPETFAVGIPARFAEKVHSYHVVANHYNLGTS
jgi:hypothetical protein